MENEIEPAGAFPTGIEGPMLTLPLKQRCVLRLLYRRGAEWWEVAGALGISIHSLRRRIRQALKRAEDPLYVAMLQSWKHLDSGERRLLYLHRVLGLSLREIIRQGLACESGQPVPDEAAPCVTTLRRRVRRIDRKAARLARQAHRRPAPALPQAEPEEVTAPQGAPA